MTEPDYIVIRPADNLPPGFLPERFDGMWFDRTTVPQRAMPVRAGMCETLAVPTGRFEVRDDGAVAEVWEVAP